LFQTALHLRDDSFFPWDLRIYPACVGKARINENLLAFLVEPFLTGKKEA
jgi:hypothetical protein